MQFPHLSSVMLKVFCQPRTPATYCTVKSSIICFNSAPLVTQCDDVSLLFNAWSHFGVKQVFVGKTTNYDLTFLAFRVQKWHRPLFHSCLFSVFFLSSSSSSAPPAFSPAPPSVFIFLLHLKLTRWEMRRGLWQGGEVFVVVCLKRQ